MSPTVKINIYRKNNAPSIYMLHYYSLVNENLVFEIIPPYFNASSTYLLHGLDVREYVLNIGTFAFRSSQNIITASIKTPGVYPISVKINFKNGTTYTHAIEDVVTIYEKWPIYDYAKKRVLDINSNAVLPYTIDQVSLKPNEFGVADVINASILKLNECVEFLKKSSTIIYNKTPTKYIGWLGVHKDYLAHGIRWYTTSNTINLSKDYINNYTEKALNNFNNITDIKIINNELYVADLSPEGDPRFSFGYLSTTYKRTIYGSTFNFLSQVKNISSIEVYFIDDNTRTIYLLDSISNKLHKVTLYIDTESFIAEQTVGVYGSLEQTVGGFGDLESASKFYSPTQLFFKDQFLYVVDSNNFCVKKFTANLGWVKTFYIEDFKDSNPISITTSRKNINRPELIYILTKDARIYVLNTDGTIFNDNLPYIELTETTDTPTKLIIDESEEFFYVIYPHHVSKYSTLGMYINIVDVLPNTSTYVSGATDSNHSIYIADTSKIFKFVDIVEDFSIISPSYDSLYWSEDEIKIDENEFIQDWSINKSLFRVASNLKTFKSSLHSRYGLNTVYSLTEVLTYYTAIPVARAESELCNNDVLEDIGVGANELAVTQVINRNIEKIYRCIESLLPYVNAAYLTKEEGGSNCSDTFCWSWKATSCFNISLPVLRVCNINPVTFNELRSTFKNSYAPSSVWKDAFSDCCSNIS